MASVDQKLQQQQPAFNLDRVVKSATLNHDERRKEELRDHRPDDDDDDAMTTQSLWKTVLDARPILPKAAFFLGDLRDGLPMVRNSKSNHIESHPLRSPNLLSVLCLLNYFVSRCLSPTRAHALFLSFSLDPQLNMEAAFLISTKQFDEKQVGALCLAFGISQFLCMAPAGYFLDYSNQKIQYVTASAVLCSALTVLTAVTAKQYGQNLYWLMLVKILQGGITAIIPPGFNGITLGIVGSTGFTHQVSRNRMMTHIGTALFVAIGSLMSYFLYPKIGALFLVSPVAALGVFYNLRRIVPTHVDRDAARALIITSRTMTDYYEFADDVAAAKQQAVIIGDDDDNISDDAAFSLDSTGRKTELHNNTNVQNTSTAMEPAPSETTAATTTTTPYYRFPSDDGPLPPSAVGSHTPPRRQGSRQSSQPSSYQPPAVMDLFTDDEGLAPPSSTNDDNNNNSNISNNGNASSDGNNPRSLYPPLPPSPSRAYRVSSAGSRGSTLTRGAGAASPDPRQLSLLTSQRQQHQHRDDRNDTNNADARYDTDQDSSEGPNNHSHASRKSYSSLPSFNFGLTKFVSANAAPNTSGGRGNGKHDAKAADEPCASSAEAEAAAMRGEPLTPRSRLRARTPLAVLLNPHLMVFCCVVFFFHLANSAVLPLVMQNLSLKDPQAGILLSGLCILIAQTSMAWFAKLCGDYSPYWGRKNLMLVGLASLTLRCFLLTFLVSFEDNSIRTEQGSHALKALILSTQFLDSVGAGILGTLQILVTNDLAGGSGRFSLLLGVTTSSMCLGATVSSYVGQLIAYEDGYPMAFTALGILSLIPFAMYIFFMPETLPDYARPAQPKMRKRRLRGLLRRLNDQRRRILQSKNNPFRRNQTGDDNEVIQGGKAASPISTRHVELV